MSYIYRYIFCFLILQYSNYGICHEKFSNSFNQCKASRHVIDDYEPKTFNLSNNLITTSKLPNSSKKIEKIVIFGKLLDTKCIPIPNASIYAWQVGPDGKYPYIPLRTRAVMNSLFTGKKTSFVGSASTVTDNNGNFVLIAAMPRKLSHPTTHGINIRAEHENISKIQIRFTPSSFHEIMRPIKYPSFFKSDMDDTIKAYNLKIVMQKESQFLGY